MSVGIESVLDRLVSSIKLLLLSVRAGRESAAVSRRESGQERWLAEAIIALNEAERVTALFARIGLRQDVVLMALQADIRALRRQIEFERDINRPTWRIIQSEWIECSVWHPILCAQS